MSRQTARVALDQMIGRPALIAPTYVQVAGENMGISSLRADMRDLASCDPKAEMIAWTARKEMLVEAYGLQPGDLQGSKPFAFGDGKAIIPIHGTLINRFAYSFGFVTGYNFIRSQVAAAEADPEVTGIIFDVNSNGGTVAGCAETGQIIADTSKPTLACVDSNCYSAAYWLASQTDRISMTPSGGAGSIGVILMHADMSKMLDDIGIKITMIHAGKHKVDGNPFEPLSEEVQASLQAEVDTMYDQFVSTVASGRANMTEAAVRATEADTYFGAAALEVGLVDAIQTPNDAVSTYFDNDDDEGTDEMATSNTPLTDAQIAENNAAGERAATEAAATARTAERARISGIQGHAEAADRTALANHLAMNTDMSVEAAGAILAAAPKQAAAAAPAATQEPNHFANAMNGTPNPNVGAGSGAAASGEGTEEGSLTPAQRILAAGTRAGTLPRLKAPEGRVN